jgi:hypothetical protein
MSTACFNILKLHFPYAVSYVFRTFPRINSDNFLKPLFCVMEICCMLCKVGVVCLSTINLNVRLEMVNAFKRNRCYAQHML